MKKHTKKHANNLSSIGHNNPPKDIEPIEFTNSAILGVLALFYFYDHGSNSIFSSKEKFYTCEVGMVKKQNVINDGGPEIMVLKFNLKTKLPNAYINDRQKLRNGTYKIEEASSTQHVADYELRFKLKTMHNHTITYEGYSGRTELSSIRIINSIGSFTHSDNARKHW